jgi:hypothetical protein
MDADVAASLLRRQVEEFAWALGTDTQPVIKEHCSTTILDKSFDSGHQP